MESFALAMRVVAPLFLLMALGYGMRRAGLASKEFFGQLNRLVFAVFLPVMLFNSVYRSDFSASFKPGLVAVALGLTTVGWLLAALVYGLSSHNPARRGVLIQGSCRSNFVLFGIPVAISLFGADNVGVTAVLITFIVPLINVYSTVALEMNRGGRVNVGHLIRAILTNPLIDATLLAIAMLLLGVRLPSIVETTVADVAGIASPLAIIVLGGMFEFSRVGGNLKALAATSAFKLVVMPALVIGVGVLLGYRGVDIGALLAMAASPTAVASFAMAQNMGGDAELAGQAVVVTSAASIVTLFFWVFALSSAGVL